MSNIAQQELGDEEHGKNFGQSLAKQYLQSWEQILDDGEAKSTYDYSKIAKDAAINLGDSTWASYLLNKAKALATDHFSFAELREIALQMGDTLTSETLLQQVADACNNPSQAMQLASRLLTKGIAVDLVKHYTSMKIKFTDPKDHLSWASGIVQSFKDQDWASQEYEDLSSAFSDGADAKRFKANKDSNLEPTFW